MIILKDFVDKDLPSIRKSIFTFSAIYSFFYFAEGFHIQPGGLFQTISGQPLTFAASTIHPILGGLFFYLLARLILVGAAEYHSNNKFVDGGSQSTQAQVFEILSEIKEIEPSIIVLSERIQLLLDELKGLKKIDVIDELESKLLEINDAYNTEWERHHHEVLMGKNVKLEGIREVFKKVRQFCIENESLVKSIDSLQSNMSSLHDNLGNFGRRSLNAQLTKLIDLCRSNTRKSYSWRKLSFLTLETVLPALLAFTCLSHAFYVYYAPFLISLFQNT